MNIRSVIKIDSFVAWLASLAALLLTMASAQTPAPATNPAGREVLSLDEGWRFNLGDIPFPAVTGHRDSYNNAKAGRASGAAAADYDDTGWRGVDLPHDWVVEGPFVKGENPSQGYRPRGIAWYRRNFQLPDPDRGRHLELKFDGVATHCTVWVNGIVAHRNWCGYTSFSINITPYARYGRELNSVVVRVDANAQEGWWYEGGGIYRHTWLVKRDPVHVVTDGVFANPTRQPDGKWRIPAEVTVENSGADAASFEVDVALLDAAGKEVVRRRSPAATVAALDRSVARLDLPVEAPALWSVDRPTLYQVRTTVLRDGKATDAVATNAGFRTIRFDADKGFFLNDQPLKLKGVCNHQDHAGVGVALPDSLLEFRVRRLKEMGANAYRCAHNPPAKEFLDECDRQGMLVMDENRNFNPNEEYVRQLEWLIRRDRNHPSVILWSIFNEEPMQGTEAGYQMVRQMAAVVKRLDSTRPVTAAMNGGLFTPINVSQAVDVVGFNYQHGEYDRFHAANPKLPLTSSEDTSAFMTRGESVTDKSRGLMGSYDDNFARWGLSHRRAWKEIDERPFLAGGFVWTGFDYRGEPTPYGWPAASTFFGIMDLCGFPKSAYYIHQAHWIKDRPILRLEPHWNWPGREGQPVQVMAISNADTVALSLNGKPLGEKPVDKYEMVSWDVPYAAGKLEAVAKKDGREVARFAVETTGAPAALRLVPDRAALAGDGWDAQPVTVEAIDAQGRVVPTANLPVEFELEGSGVIIGLGNGDPNCHEPEKGNQRSVFHGLAQVILQSKRAGVGPLTLRAKSAGLKPAEATIAIQAVAPRPAVPPRQQVFAVQGWRMSPVSTTAPDPNQELADSDQNSWTTVRDGDLQSFVGGNFAVLRSPFRPSWTALANGGTIRFAGITGRAEVWIDGKSAGRKDDFATAPFAVPFPPGKARERTLSVLVETRPNEPAGLSGPVTVEAAPKPQ